MYIHFTVVFLRWALGTPPGSDQGGDADSWWFATYGAQRGEVVGLNIVDWQVDRGLTVVSAKSGLAGRQESRDGPESVGKFPQCGPLRN